MIMDRGLVVARSDRATVLMSLAVWSKEEKDSAPWVLRIARKEKISTSRVCGPGHGNDQSFQVEENSLSPFFPLRSATVHW
jgi:hypothetical protein